MEHTISGLAKNQPGVLAQIASFFGKHGINIKSLAVGETENEKVSRLTIVVEAKEEMLRNIVEQLNKLDEIIKLDDLTRNEFIDRELILVKLVAREETMPKVMQLVEIFRANVVGVGMNTLTIEMSGDHEKINGILRLLKKYGIKALARTGKLAMKRDDNA